MTASHFVALLVLFILFVLSIWIKRVLVDSMALGYILVLAYVAIINQWEILFYPILTLMGLITVIMLCAHALRGDLI